MATQIDVTINADVRVEAQYEYLYLQLTSLVGTTFGGSDSTYTSGTIYEDDDPVLSAPPAPVLNPRPASVKEGDTGTRTMRLPLVLDRALPGALTVHAVVENGDVPPDFDDVDTTITIAAGQLVGYIDVVVHGDTRDEANAESVYVLLTDVTGGATFPSGQTDEWPYGYALILDDDITVPPAPVLTPRSGSVREGDGGTRTMRIPLVLDRTLPDPADRARVRGGR